MYKYIRCSSYSANWGITIDISDYFPPEAFDEDGQFNEDFTTEIDWIDFNFNELAYGFGDTKNLYAAVMLMAGVPVNRKFLKERIDHGGVDNDGGMEFIMWGDEDLGIPDIRFGFGMDIYGTEAQVWLDWAHVIEEDKD